MTTHTDARPAPNGLQRYEELIEQWVTRAVGASGERADKLVRFVDGGKVEWITAAMARDRIERRRQDPSGPSQRTAAGLERALRGDIQVLVDELMILLCVAQAECLENGQCAEVRHRLDSAVNLSWEARESEFEFNRQKQSNRLLGDFENKVSRFVQARNDGDESKARHLAAELETLKRRYLLHTKTVQPALARIRGSRIELMKMKEKILAGLSNGLSRKIRKLTGDKDALAKSMEMLETALGGAADKPRLQFAAAREKLGELRAGLEGIGEAIEAARIERAAVREELVDTRAVIREMGGGEAGRPAETVRAPGQPARRDNGAPAGSGNSRMVNQSD